MVQLATVQRILRHTDPKITSEVYGHLDLEDMRAAGARVAAPGAASACCYLAAGTRGPEKRRP